MKKLFISCPMKGRTDENIKKSIEKMHKMAELVFDQPLEVIDSYIEGDVPGTNHQAVYYLGRSIQKLAEADYFIGIHYGYGFDGCCVETDVARRYNIPAYFVRPNIIMPDIETHKCGRHTVDYKGE